MRDCSGGQKLTLASEGSLKSGPPPCPQYANNRLPDTGRGGGGGRWVAGGGGRLFAAGGGGLGLLVAGGGGLGLVVVGGGGAAFEGHTTLKQKSQMVDVGLKQVPGEQHWRAPFPLALRSHPSFRVHEQGVGKRVLQRCSKI